MLFPDGEKISAVREKRTKELERLLHKKPVWDFYPDFQKQAQVAANDVSEALENYIQALWNEALRCYVDSLSCACIAMSSVVLESALKHQLESRPVTYPGKATLGTCIQICKHNGILPNNDSDPITKAAIKVWKARNDIVHANFPRYRPRSVLEFEGTEHKKTKLGLGIQAVYPFENLAKRTIVNTNLVLEHLYPGIT